MEKLMKVGGVTLGIILCLMFVNSLVYSYYPPYRGWVQSWNADVNREVFQNTKPFVAGTIQELKRYRNDYNLTTDVNQKMVILTAAREISSELDQDKLPEDLKSWLNNY